MNFLLISLVIVEQCKTILIKCIFTAYIYIYNTGKKKNSKKKEKKKTKKNNFFIIISILDKVKIIEKRDLV